MKKIYLISWYFISTSVLHAQVLTNANGFLPEVVIHNSVSIDSPLDEGNSGPGEAWDFSTLTASDPAQDFTGVTVGDSPYAGDFPGSTVAVNYVDFFDDNTYSYYINDDTVYAYTGYENAAAYAVYFNPIDILRYPFAYGNSFTDTYYAPFGLGYNSGVVTVTADGTGDLILPGGTFHNCLRVKETRIDTTEGEVLLLTSMDTTYKFYCVDFAEPLCQVVYHHFGDGSSLKEIYWQDLSPLDVPDMQNKEIAVWPNPCTDAISIQLPQEAEPVSVTLRDMAGKQMKINYTREQNMLHFNTAELPEGIYILSIEINRKLYTAKFMKAE